MGPASATRAVLGTDVPLGGVPLSAPTRSTRTRVPLVPLGGVLYTDARWFGAHGIPTVMYGAGSGDLVEAGVNGQDENVAEEDVYLATQVVARVIAVVLSGHAEAMG